MFFLKNYFEIIILILILIYFIIKYISISISDNKKNDIIFSLITSNIKELNKIKNQINNINTKEEKLIKIRKIYNLNILYSNKILKFIEKDD